jgi:hypothetical protein
MAPSNSTASRLLLGVCLSGCAARNTTALYRFWKVRQASLKGRRGPIKGRTLSRSRRNSRLGQKPVDVDRAASIGWEGSASSRSRRWNRGVPGERLGNWCAPRVDVGRTDIVLHLDIPRGRAVYTSRTDRDVYTPSPLCSCRTLSSTSTVKRTRLPARSNDSGAPTPLALEAAAGQDWGSPSWPRSLRLTKKSRGGNYTRKRRNVPRPDPVEQHRR